MYWFAADRPRFCIRTANSLYPNTRVPDTQAPSSQHQNDLMLHSLPLSSNRKTQGHIIAHKSLLPFLPPQTHGIILLTIKTTKALSKQNIKAKPNNQTMPRCYNIPGNTPPPPLPFSFSCRQQNHFNHNPSHLPQKLAIHNFPPGGALAPYALHQHACILHLLFRISIFLPS